MKLNPIAISQLTYLDSGQFIVRYLTDYAASGLDPTSDSVFKELHDDLVNQSPIFNQALMQIRTQTETEELTILDAARDQKIAALRRAHSVFEHTDDSDEKASEIILAHYINFLFIFL